MIKVITFYFFLMFCFDALAIEKFPNLLFLEGEQQSPPADLSAVKWLSGHWRGEAFGGLIEEVWSPPVVGSMMGAFKLVVENEVQFYEIETISEENGTLIFRLKHFHSDLKGWEEKDKTFDFPLVKLTENKVYFNGLTLERINDKEMNIYVAIESDGSTTEQKFTYQRFE
ncbi:DUF6265 family protein [Aliiglaciecola sp. LCG003]|uniref:DUF6265 family protein n=1 Tax=Aliiglaciecola sp. LCG003 TaxID=3053655 RepID=UPI002573CC62|nr:DUF6265 family protein [Aliiglaciecola sp. LCG003]WJG08100.1 DUF6265 family protein [Aliiglaciecola sp. LCG003]